MIATRIPKFKEDGETREIPIRIFAAKDRGDSWSCCYEIGWPQGLRAMEMFGYDSVQAILLTVSCGEYDPRSAG
jgi:hypothetical protein